MATILILNGDEAGATLLAEFFSWQGHRTIAAASVDEARGWVESRLVSLLVSERIVPWPGGESVPETLGPACDVAGVPILIWTADVMEGQRDSIVATGARFLAKPAPLGEIGRVVDELLDAGRTAAT